jgi:predicted enzyme related to lactoylglutathione lyase
MPTIPTGKFVWFEYVSKDSKKAQAFFGELFHWKAKDAPMAQSSYTMIALGDDTIGGYLPPFANGPQQPYWLSHLQVANVQDSASKVKQLGGEIVKEPFKVADIGTMAVVTDPLGGIFALWQFAKLEDAGAGDYKGLDGSWLWNELYTADPDKSVAFYKAVGGFEVETMKQEGAGPGPDRYEILKSDGKGRGGIMKLAGLPQMWMPYVKVANTDATVERAKQLGATFKVAAETIPKVGRIAVLADPLGVPLGILQPSPM